MARVLACIDGSIYAGSVAAHAAWAAARLGAGVELLHVIGRREATSDDRSGRILPAVLKHRRSIKELLSDPFMANNSNDATHSLTACFLVKMARQ